MRASRMLAVLSALCFLAACDRNGSTLVDLAADTGAGSLDAGSSDAGSSDAGSIDAGSAGEADPDAGLRSTDAATIQDAGRSDSSGTQDAGTTEAPAGPVEKTYRVLHWNIAGGKENDCESAGITRAVRRYVDEHDLDFVGLNEVCPAQYRSIRDALRSHWSLGPRRAFSAYVGDGAGRTVGNAIYSRFGLEDVTKNNLGSDQFGDRNLLCGRVPSLPHLRFCSTHLSVGDTQASRQLGRVLDRLEGWWNNRRDTVILTGDLNLTANHSALNTVYTQAANTPNNPGNRGKYHELDDDDPNHCRGYGERSVPSTTGGPCQQGGKIDFIFVRANRIVNGQYGGDTLNVPTDCSGRCSDHRAVKGHVRARIRQDR